MIAAEWAGWTRSAHCQVGSTPYLVARYRVDDPRWVKWPLSNGQWSSWQSQEPQAQQVILVGSSGTQ